MSASHPSEAEGRTPLSDGDVIDAIIEVLYDGDSPNVTDVEAAARHNPTNMARCYAKILGIISAHGIAGLEADALDTLQSSRVENPAAPSVEARDACPFTREDVELLTRCADGCDGTEDCEDDEPVFPDGIRMYMRDVKRLRSLVSRIAALLPPEKT